MAAALQSTSVTSRKWGLRNTCKGEHALLECFLKPPSAAAYELVTLMQGIKAAAGLMLSNAGVHVLRIEPRVQGFGQHRKTETHRFNPLRPCFLLSGPANFQHLHR